jgi:dipeptidyl aminopeptidase/acylaminoacyl peptidase
VFDLMLRGLAAMSMLMGAAVATAAPPTAEDFASRPAIESVVMSPSGRRMAILMPAADGRVRLGVMDLDPVSQPRVVAAFSDANVTSVHWVNDDRLVFEAFQDGAVIRSGGAGTFAVNHDASDQAQLIAWNNDKVVAASAIASRVLPYGWYYRSSLDDGSDDILVVRDVRNNIGETTEIQLSRLNTRTRERRSLNLGIPEGTQRWLTDREGQPRVVVARRAGRNKVFWRAPQSDEWSELADFDPLSEPGYTPRWVDEDGSVIVTSRQGSDTQGLYRLDPKTKRIEPQALVLVKGFDLSPVLETDTKTKRLLGLHIVADRPMSVWFDVKLQALQQSIDAALPKGRTNQIYCGRCESSRFLVVLSTSDRQPGEYFLFDRGKGTLERLGASRPRIDEASQGKQTLHRVAARDGLSLPVYVTHPPGSEAQQALPAVVLVHGGPWARGASLAWSADAQFLATRGYRVIEPEFRGSEGYGFRHFKAGWKQWGAAMQDDLVDAVQWAAKQGLVDPSRVCIVGASYGGYASLMAPIVHPGVFRCAASFAGVTDINLMYDIQWSDLSEDHKRYGMPTLIGDQRKDEAMLAAASPLKRVAELKIPLLLAHGAEDRRVPIEHAQRFLNAARAAGVAIEYQEYRSEGHGFFNAGNEADYYKRLEKFLEKSLLSVPGSVTPK